MEVAKQHTPAYERKPSRERVALLAALLHDLGHGPFSHAFEEAEKARLKDRPGAYKSHEKWTAEIITREDGNIRQILVDVFGSGGSIADDIAGLLINEPSDIYSAVVSSSFDADRLDYLQRDKMMTGSGAGSIDFEWLLDNLRIASLQVDADDALSEAEGTQISTFCFAEKAAQAAEAFILARFHLYSQVYLHKTTRGMEQLLSAFLRALSDIVRRGSIDEVCLPASHPLVRYYAAKTPSIEDYLALDDTAVWSAVEAASRGTAELASVLAKRLRRREKFRAIEIAVDHPSANERARKAFIETDLADKIGTTIFRDRVPLTVYGGLDESEAKPHKRVRIRRLGEQAAVDITAVSKAVAALTEKQEILRYYFLENSLYERVRRLKA